MTPTRLPVEIRGDVPGLLCRGVPVLPPDTTLPMRPGEHDSAVVCMMPDPKWLEAEPDACAWIGYSAFNVWRQHRAVRPGALTIDWSSPLAIYAALHWLADRGHVATWMLPTTHGGRVEAWDGMTAWEVSAVLVSHSVRRVVAGKRPVRMFYARIEDLRRDYNAPWETIEDAVEHEFAIGVPGGIAVPE